MWRGGFGELTGGLVVMGPRSLMVVFSLASPSGLLESHGSTFFTTAFFFTARRRHAMTFAPFDRIANQAPRHARRHEPRRRARSCHTNPFAANNLTAARAPPLGATTATTALSPIWSRRCARAKNGARAPLARERRGVQKPALRDSDHSCLLSDLSRV